MMNDWTNNWQLCLDKLEKEVTAYEFNTLLRPMQAVSGGDCLRLLVPNRYALDQIKEKYLGRIRELCRALANGAEQPLRLEVGSPSLLNGGSDAATTTPAASAPGKKGKLVGRLNSDFCFSSFVTGDSNKLAMAAAAQVAEHPGKFHNPLVIYGGVGLGKTHLMHAVGNAVLERDPGADIACLRSERFVNEMITAIGSKKVDAFTDRYRCLDVLLIDDIQFFAGKSKSQEMFFHTFNSLLEAGSQVVLTCDRYPKDIEKIENRLISRFVNGLAASIEPPEYETRVAIVKSKAENAGIELPEDAASFIADRFSSNVRDLEGALHRVVADSNLAGRPIELESCRQALRDLLQAQERLITPENIKEVVAKQFGLRVVSLASKKKHRSVVRPRQMAMALMKELTNLSLPEIGNLFGGRDHTTVLHACRKIDELRKQDNKVAEDYENLRRILAR